MASPAATTVDVSQALAMVLGSVDGLRVYWYVADTVRPSACVIAQPDINFVDPDAGFCAATWLFPLTLIVSRANDLASQQELSRLLFEIVRALGAADAPGIFSIEPQNARPIPVTVNGQDLPGYQLIVKVRA